MSNRVFSPGSSPLEEGLPVPHRSEHHAELKHQTPVTPSSASALLSLNKQRPFTYSPTHPPTIKRDLLDCLHKLTTYLPTCLLSRQNPYLPALHQTITIGLIIRPRIESDREERIRNQTA